jgi:hypothetical protein
MNAITHAIGVPHGSFKRVMAEAEEMPQCFMAWQAPLDEGELVALVAGGVLACREVMPPSSPAEGEEEPPQQQPVKIYHWAPGMHRATLGKHWQQVLHLARNLHQAQDALEVAKSSAGTPYNNWSEEEITDRASAHIRRLHEYNDLKDAGQLVMGRIASKEGVIVSALYPQFGLEIED